MLDLLYILALGAVIFAYFFGAQFIMERLEPYLDHQNSIIKWLSFTALVITSIPLILMIGYVLFIFVDALFSGGLSCWPGKYGECD